MILVSACLLGENCKYNGGNNDNIKVHDFLANKEYRTFCPECLGDLSIPRSPIEITSHGTALNRDGEDKTSELKLGAKKSLQLCEDLVIDLVILRDGSPSCGVHNIYDGTFSGKKIPGKGMTTQLLTKNGFKIISENDL